MAQCNKKLPPGNARPRTCAKCGLMGVCTEEVAAPQGHTQFLMKVTGDIQTLPFRDMLTLARHLQVSLPEKGVKELSVAEIAEALLSAAEHVNPTKTASTEPRFPYRND